MLRTILLGLAAVAFALALMNAATAESQSAEPILNKMFELESRRAQGVSDYAMDVTMMGHESTLFYERVSIPVAGRKPIETFRLVSFEEIQARQQSGQGMSPEAWQAYSDAMRQTGSAVNQETNRGMNEAGLPPGMLDALGAGSEAEPWASPNPSTMMGSLAGFADAAGEASSKQRAGTRREDSTAETMAQFRKRAKVVSKGKGFVHLRAEGLDLVEEVDGQKLKVESVSLWLDAKQYVPLKMRMDGVVTSEGQSQPMFIERLDEDYRTVPGSKLYMPYRNVMRMGGILGPQQQKEMEDARKQLDELERELASMPSDQRAMVEQMAGSQIAMLEKMVESGEMTVVTTVRAVRVNTGLAGAFGNKPATQTKPASTSVPSAPPSNADFVVQSIQRDLIALGYDPGSTDGQLSPQTVMAISKFQAENGLEVTGEATPQLAGILAAKRDAASGASASTAASSAGSGSLEDAQKVCLQEKIEAAKKKKRAFGRLMQAAGNTASRYGGAKVSSEVEKASREAYKADATAKDVEEAARALGISQEDVEACRNPK